MELKEGQGTLILETKGGSSRGGQEGRWGQSCKAWIGRRSLDFMLSVMGNHRRVFKQGVASSNLYLLPLTDYSNFYIKGWDGEP